MRCNTVKSEIVKFPCPADGLTNTFKNFASNVGRVVIDPPLVALGSSNATLYCYLTNY